MARKDFSEVSEDELAELIDECSPKMNVHIIDGEQKQDGAIFCQCDFLDGLPHKMLRVVGFNFSVAADYRHFSEVAAKYQVVEVIDCQFEVESSGELLSVMQTLLSDQSQPPQFNFIFSDKVPAVMTWLANVMMLHPYLARGAELAITSWYQATGLRLAIQADRMSSLHICDQRSPALRVAPATWQWLGILSTNANYEQELVGLIFIDRIMALVGARPLQPFAERLAMLCAQLSLAGYRFRDPIIFARRILASLPSAAKPHKLAPHEMPRSDLGKTIVQHTYSLVLWRSLLHQLCIGIKARIESLEYDFEEPVDPSDDTASAYSNCTVWHRQHHYFGLALPTQASTTAFTLTDDDPGKRSACEDKIRPAGCAEETTSGLMARM